jgi:transposase
MAVGRKQTKSKQPNATAYRKRRRKFADKKSGRKRPRKLDKPQKENNSDILTQENLINLKRKIIAKLTQETLTAMRWGFMMDCF